MHPDARYTPDSRLAARTRVVLRPLGSPLPLGLLALAPAGLLLSALQVGAFSQSETTTVALLVLAFAAPLDAIAAVLCFLARDTLGGSGLGVFAGAWLASGLVLLTSPPNTTSPAFGTFLLAVSCAMLVLVAAAAGNKLGPAIVIVAGAGRFLLSGLYELIGSRELEHASAIVGFALVACAVYTALATEIEDVHGRSILPIGRRARAVSALHGSFAAQLDRLENEAGVRQQL